MALYINSSLQILAFLTIWLRSSQPFRQRAPSKSNTNSVDSFASISAMTGSSFESDSF